MQFNLKDAQRKERAGNNRAADAAMENYRKFEQDQNKAEFDKENAIANIAAKGITGNRTTGKGAGGAQPSAFNVLFQAKEALAEDPTNPRLKQRVANALEAATTTKTSYSTGEIGAVNAATRLIPTQARIDADVIEKLGDFKDGDRAYNKARRAGNTTETNRLLQAEEARLRAAYQTPTAAPAKPSAAPAAAAPKPTATSKVISMADVEATVASSGRTKQEVMDAIKAKGYTVK
jgi:hypothetical protein